MKHKQTRRLVLLLTVLIGCSMSMATVQAKARIYTYVTTGDDGATVYYVYSDGTHAVVWSPWQHGAARPVPGYANDTTYVDWDNDSVWCHTVFVDGDAYCTSWSLTAGTREWDTTRVDATTTCYTTTINSNRIELYMSSRYGDHASPLTGYGRLDGVLLKMVRNGQTYLELKDVNNSAKQHYSRPQQLGRRVSQRELSRIRSEKRVIRTRLFDQAQLHWGAQPEVDLSGLTPADARQTFPYDTVIHYAGGTVVLKRLHLDTLPEHYQLFVEMHQQSNGDAYDRTGSLFIIPQHSRRTFLEGIIGHPDSLPLLTDRRGNRYQGFVATADYYPLVELVRFFTPFGVHYYNDRIQIAGLAWADEAYYKQEVSDLRHYLSGDVLIGAYIGNYDGGGHRLTVDLVAYPNNEVWQTGGDDSCWSMPLINTCNVMEMGGQTYGRLFATDSLTVDFEIPADVHQLRLRYISTGHGGWDSGDEFTPRENSIIIDDTICFRHTPWRSDCGTYRALNPVSGNFWNGTSSSDFSRSGWCPGTASQPVYFELGNLKPGHHRLTIAIPQGADIDGGFNAWNLSLMLLGSRTATTR